MSNTNKYFTINLSVNGRRYPLRIPRNQQVEEVFRRASSELDRKINRYKSKYLSAYPRVGVHKKITEIDCVIMAAIQATANKIQLEKETNALEMEEQLQQMIVELDNYLKHQ